MGQHYEDDADDTVDSSILLDAVVTWFRLYQVPFDQTVADVLCNVAISLHSSGLGGRQITDYLIQTYNGPMAIRATAPSSSAYH
jgi:hypothetical protein